MPLLIDPGEDPAITLDELVDLLDTTAWDPQDEASLVALGPALARLARHPTFLADLVVAELEARCAGQVAGNSYGPQVFLLRPPTARYALRANFWPARSDAVVRASGTAPFFYDMPHDHNFSFLTVGYRGPGYWSDYYEVDGDFVGLPGEPAGLRFVERSRLAEGRLMLYRCRRDLHVQLPPDSLSVSLNILAYDRAQPWIEQYRYDVAAGTIAEGLTVAPAEALLALAVHFCGEPGTGAALEFARRHPAPRMRATAYAALASTRADPAARALIHEAAADDPDRYVAGTARARLARMAANASG